MSTRREFLVRGGVGAAAALTVAGAAQAATTIAPLDGTPPTTLKLCCQEGNVPGRDLAEKLANLEKWGYDGIEFSQGIVGHTADVLKALANSKIKPAAVCHAAGPYQVSDKDLQQRNVDNAKRVVAAAGEIGSTGVIIVPSFNGQATAVEGWAGREILLKVLKEMGDAAVEAKCRFLLEPLNRGEAHILRQVADGASICRDVNSPGIGMMGDFYHMGREEPSLMGAFIAGGKWLHHVHMASFPRRKQPGKDAGDAAMYTDGFRGLKWIGYQEFCSLECGIEGDKNVAFPEIAKFLRDCWAAA